MNFNRVIIGGRLTRDPELRYVGGNRTAACECTLARNEHRKHRDKLTHFIVCTAWGRTAEVVSEFMSKGRPLLVEGRLQQDRWEDKNTGKARSKIKVVVETCQFVGGKGDGNRYGDRAGDDDPVSTGAPDDGRDVPF